MASTCASKTRRSRSRTRTWRRRPIPCGRQPMKTATLVGTRRSTRRQQRKWRAWQHTATPPPPRLSTFVILSVVKMASPRLIHARGVSRHWQSIPRISNAAMLSEDVAYVWRRSATSRKLRVAIGHQSETRPLHIVVVIDIQLMLLVKHKTPRDTSSEPASYNCLRQIRQALATTKNKQTSSGAKLCASAGMLATPTTRSLK